MGPWHEIGRLVQGGREPSGLNFELLAAGTRAPDWVVTGFGEYQKRLGGQWRLLLREIPTAKRSKNANTVGLKREEGDRMLAALRSDVRLVALDTCGSLLSTETLAEKCGQWMLETGQVQLMIGGPDGLDGRCVDRADLVWSLSPLTFPHFLVRILVAEQLYRAWSILNHHPYHK